MEVYAKAPYHWLVIGKKPERMNLGYPKTKGSRDSKAILHHKPNNEGRSNYVYDKKGT